MAEDGLMEAIVLELRTMATAGNDVPALLRRVQQMSGREDCKLLSIQCFQKAFDAGITAVSPIAGWRGFGSELNDDQVNTLVRPVLERFQIR